MRIVIDLPWDTSAHMGTGAYAESVVHSLASAAPTLPFAVTCTTKPQGSPFPSNVQIFQLDSQSLRHDGYRHVSLVRFLEEYQADCLFAPATLLPAVKVCPMVSTIHDLSFLENPQYYSDGLRDYLQKNLPLTLAMADRVIAISEETKHAIQRLTSYPCSRIDVIIQCIRETLRTKLNHDVATKLVKSCGITRPYFFHVSNLAPHKNLRFLLKTFKRYIEQFAAEDILLAIAGGGVAPKEPDDIVAISRDLGISDRVHYLGRVPDQILCALYRNCKAFLFPSLFEGWGLPIAEALAQDACVISSPFVPSAPKEIRTELDILKWVAAMHDPVILDFHARPKSDGLKLLDVMKNAISSSSYRRKSSVQSKDTPPRSGICGCTIIRNAVQLDYPFEESIESYAPICEEILICWDPTSNDSTSELLQRLCIRFPRIRLIESKWNLSNRVGGQELAKQTQFAFDMCKLPWTLYIQADEALHEDCHQELLTLVKQSDIAAIAFERRSFMHTLDNEILEHRAPALVRLFRTGYGKSVGDAMHCVVDGYAGRHVHCEGRIFNYSRLGNVESVDFRSRNLNRFYHNDEFIKNLSDGRNDSWTIEPYIDSHPKPIEGCFRGLIHSDSITHKSICVIITVDDIRPETGHGLELDSGPVTALRVLKEQMDCRFTLFMPTNYYSKYDLHEYPEWVGYFLQDKHFEVACHGHHHWNLKPNSGDMEYLFDSKEAAEHTVARSLRTFAAFGYRPQGVKAPGWHYSSAASAVLQKSFVYIAEHRSGRSWLLDSLIPRLPVTRCIHEQLNDLVYSTEPLIVLQSHISDGDGMHDNGWTSSNFENVMRFLRRIKSIRGDQVQFCTAKESLSQIQRPDL
jgi:glycosyltransferase involved in cell wall biosynthesis/peptidoglycan/xylan/chitin deacetylase (PgdA/CDA1 family)